MKVLKIDEPLIFSLIPRVYPSSDDILVLKMRNEFTNVSFLPLISYISGQKLSITIDPKPDDFVVGNKYEIEITNNDQTIYRGKLQIVASEQNIQNYEQKGIEYS